MPEDVTFHEAIIPKYGESTSDGSVRVRRPLVFATDEELANEPVITRPWPAPASRALKPEAKPLVTDSASADQANGARPLPKPIDELTAVNLDRELDLKHELIGLNKQLDANKEAMQKLLYDLHELMAGSGREGKFTPFLREGLGWTDKYAYNKAMRWIAAHKFRAGLIDEATYKNLTGNGSSALRGASEPEPASETNVPTLVQTFSIEDDPEAADLTQPVFTAEEVEADVETLERRKVSFYKAVLIRAMYPLAFVDWFHLGLRIQAQRHGTKTMAETLVAVVLLGTKPADPKDCWEELVDELLHDIGRDPTLALAADWIHPDDRDEVGSAEASALVPDPVKGAGYVVGGEEQVPTAGEITLDDFDDDPLL